MWFIKALKPPRFLAPALLLALSSALFCQEAALPEGTPLEKSLILLDAAISSFETIQSDNESLKADIGNLKTSLGNASLLLRTQGQLLSEQMKTHQEVLAVSERQKFLLNGELRKTKNLTLVLKIAIPSCLVLGFLAGTVLGR